MAAGPGQAVALMTRLERYLTPEQLVALLDMLEMVEQSGGFGDVAIVMQDGRVRFFRPSMSVDILKPWPARRPGS
jgi:hypothetical protein